MIEKGSFRWGWAVAGVFFFQVAFIWVISKKTKVDESFPVLELTNIENSDISRQMIMEDSLSLARPARRGFSEEWINPSTNDHKLTRWVLPNVMLPKETNLFDEVVARELSKGILPKVKVFKRSEPQLTRVFAPPLIPLEESRIVVQGRLGLRLKETLEPLKSFWRLGGFLKPTHVQILVDNEGKVISSVLLKSSGHLPADQSAMEFVLSCIVFDKSSSDTLETGGVACHWHVDPSSITNILERVP